MKKKYVLAIFIAILLVVGCYLMTCNQDVSPLPNSATGNDFQANRD